MYEFKRSLIALIGVVILVGIATITRPHTSRGAIGAGGAAASTQTQNVNVVNTPTVNAQQSGVWNVGINGTPTVTVSNFPATTSVAISGTPIVGLDAGNNTVKFDAVNNTVKVDTTNALSIRDVEGGPKHAFQAGITVTVPGNAFENFQTLAIPAGKRFVIEYVSISASQLCRLAIRTLVAGNQADYVSYPPKVSGSDDIGGVYASDREVHIYADSVQNVFFGNGVRVEIYRYDLGYGEADFRLVLSGYLVDL